MCGTQGQGAGSSDSFLRDGHARLCSGGSVLPAPCRVAPWGHPRATAAPAHPGPSAGDLAHGPDGKREEPSEETGAECVDANRGARERTAAKAFPTVMPGGP